MSERTSGEREAAKAISLRMRDKGVNKAQLARTIEATPDTVGDFLNGRTWPHPNTQAAIEKALELPLGTIEAIAGGARDEAALRLVAPLEGDHGPLSLDDATDLQLALALLERIRKRVEGA